MKELNTFSEIIEKIKDIISHKYKGYILDKYVADELNLQYNTLRYYKVKNIIPLQKLLVFCAENEISLDWLLFDKGFAIKKLNVCK